MIFQMLGLDLLLYLMKHTTVNAGYCPAAGLSDDLWHMDVLLLCHRNWHLRRGGVSSIKLVRFVAGCKLFLDGSTGTRQVEYSNRELREPEENLGLHLLGI